LLEELLNASLAFLIDEMVSSIHTAAGDVGRGGGCICFGDWHPVSTRKNESNVNFNLIIFGI
jgi:hypothetical protein